MLDKGYVQVYTGNGKGKTTAAFGLVLRTICAGNKAFIGQFMKGQSYSELKAMEYLPVVWDGIAECARVLRPGGRFLFIATKNSFMGKLIAATWKNKVLDPDHVRYCMGRVGIDQIETLRFPWYFGHVDATIMALLGRKG